MKEILLIVPFLFLLVACTSASPEVTPGLVPTPVVVTFEKPTAMTEPTPTSAPAPTSIPTPEPTATLEPTALNRPAEPAPLLEGSAEGLKIQLLSYKLIYNPDIRGMADLYLFLIPSEGEATFPLKSFLVTLDLGESSSAEFLEPDNFPQVFMVNSRKIEFTVQVDESSNLEVLAVPLRNVPPEGIRNLGVTWGEVPMR